MESRITFKNPFHQKHNPYSREYHEYYPNDFVENYGGYEIWRYTFSQWDIVKDGVIVGMRAGLNGAKKRIDEILCS